MRGLDRSSASAARDEAASRPTSEPSGPALRPPPVSPHRRRACRRRRQSTGKRWLITGNEATGLGAIRGGVRFAAAYPITPATEILEWLAPNLARVGGMLLQAEDELASINMAIGASYGGAARSPPLPDPACR